MIALILSKIRVYSLPLGEMHREGYAAMVPRVCQISHKRERWTGFGIVPESVITTGFYPHGKEFDVEFPDRETTSGFLVGDWGDVIELDVPRMPKLGNLMTPCKPVLPGQTLFVIGSILGIPFTLASGEVEKVILTNEIMNAERLSLLDPHSVGSPVFNGDASLVGILEAYIEKTNKMIVRSLITNGIRPKIQ